MSTINVAVLETTTIGKINLECFYKSIFASLGYETKFFNINESDNKSQDGYGVFESESIDVFVSDLSLGKEETYDGLTVIKKIKKAYPSLLVIANSMTNVTFVLAASHIPSFDIFVSKSKMHDETYQKYITGKIKSLFAKNVYLVEFDIDEALKNSKFFKKTKDRIQLKDMLKSITFTSNNNDASTVVNKVTLSEMSAGYSGSEVYRISAFTQSKLKCINAVIKISTKDNYIEEMGNYLKFVKWYLPYTFRPELIGSAETKDYGALCYSFAYNDEVPFKSLTECLRTGDSAKLELAIENIFDPKHRRWYHENNIEKSQNITKYYFDKWFSNRTVNEQQFCQIIRSAGADVHDNKVIVNGRQYPRPEGFLLGMMRDEHSTCICHGDLNSDNILIAENGGLTFIDFQNTKRGHIFEDFVVFETCIRLHVNYSEELAVLINDEWALNESAISNSVDFNVGNRSDIKSVFYPQILKLRAYAKLNAPNESWINYFYALALYCFRLLRIEEFPDWRKEQVVACLLSAERIIQSLESNLLSSR